MTSPSCSSVEVIVVSCLSVTYRKRCEIDAVEEEAEEGEDKDDDRHNLFIPRLRCKASLRAASTDEGRINMASRGLPETGGRRRRVFDFKPHGDLQQTLDDLRMQVYIQC